jgi:uncharacterized OB-fold protein
MAVIPPVPDLNDQYFWDGVQQHRLVVQRCAQCGSLRLPPVPMCGACHSTEWNTLRASGEGTIYSWIISRHPSLADAQPRIVVLVQLAEGPRVVSNLVDVELADFERADVRNGAAVRLCFREVDGVLLPQFQLVEVAS